MRHVEQFGIREPNEKKNGCYSIKRARDDAHRTEPQHAKQRVHTHCGYWFDPFKPIKFEEKTRLDIKLGYPTIQDRAAYRE